jgi:hypothetical protein
LVRRAGVCSSHRSLRGAALRPIVHTCTPIISLLNKAVPERVGGRACSMPNIARQAAT